MFTSPTMKTRTEELIAVDGSGFALDEAALKRLMLLFHRIANQAMPILRSKASFETPEFFEARIGLIEAGVFFQPDENLEFPRAHQNTQDLLTRDTDQILKPTTGLNTREVIAARKDEKKSAEIRSKKFDPETLDPARLHKMLEAVKRVSTNVTRLLSTQLRKARNLDAYAVVPAEFNSLDQDLDDEGSHNHDVMKITLTSLPAPSDDVSWKQIIEYRSDPDSFNRFLDLKEWMTDTARGKLTPVEVREKLEFLLDQYRKHFVVHEINTVNATLETFIVTTADALRSLATVRWGKAESLFSLQRRKVALLEEESTSEGSVVAFAMPSEFVNFLP